MNNMDRIIEYIESYKGKVMPDDVFDLLMQLLRKVEEAQTSCQIVKDITDGLVNCQTLFGVGGMSVDMEIKVHNSTSPLLRLLTDLLIKTN